MHSFVVLLYFSTDWRVPFVGLEYAQSPRLDADGTCLELPSDGTIAETRAEAKYTIEGKIPFIVVDL